MGFRQDNDAVDAVVGSILVIAIGIALAVGLFIMVHKLKDQTHVEDDKPDLGMSISANEPKVTVARASDNLDWSRDLRISGTCQPTLNGGLYPTSPGTLVKGGDVLACSWGQKLIISSSPAKGNSVLFSHTFPNSA